MKAFLLSIIFALGFVGSAAALPKIVCQEAGEVAQQAMANRQAGMPLEENWLAMEPKIEEARLVATIYGVPNEQFDAYLEQIRTQVFPILYNIKVQRTPKARANMAVKAGTLVYARCLLYKL